jgi:hypothetical protein
LKKVPKKLERLAELNEVMAFKPWVLNSEHVGMLLKGSGGDSSLNWTL